MSSETTTTTTTTKFTHQDALALAESFSRSEGSWGRYAMSLRAMTAGQVEEFNATIEAQKIEDSIDFILFVEGGISPADIEGLRADLEDGDEDDSELAIKTPSGNRGVVIRSPYAPYPEGNTFEVTPSNRSSYGEPEDGDEVLALVMSRHHVPRHRDGDRQPAYEIEGHMTLAHGFKGTVHDSVERWAKILDDTILKVVWLRVPTSSKGYYFESAVAIRQEDLETIGVDLDRAVEVAESEMRRVASWVDGETFEVLEYNDDDDTPLCSYIYGTEEFEATLKSYGYDDTEARDLALKALDLEA